MVASGSEVLLADDGGIWRFGMCELGTEFSQGAAGWRAPRPGFSVTFSRFFLTHLRLCHTFPGLFLSRPGFFEAATRLFASYSRLNIPASRLFISSTRLFPATARLFFPAPRFFLTNNLEDATNNLKDFPPNLRKILPLPVFAQFSASRPVLPGSRPVPAHFSDGESVGNKQQMKHITKNTQKEK